MRANILQCCRYGGEFAAAALLGFQRAATRQEGRKSRGVIVAGPAIGSAQPTGSYCVSANFIGSAPRAGIGRARQPASRTSRHRSDTMPQSASSTGPHCPASVATTFQFGSREEMSRAKVHVRGRRAARRRWHGDRAGDPDRRTERGTAPRPPRAAAPLPAAAVDVDSDPPRSYAEISETLQIPIGSIGPQRARCLERLRRTAALAGFGAGEMRVNSTEARTFVTTGMTSSSWRHCANRSGAAGRSTVVHADRPECLCLARHRRPARAADIRLQPRPCAGNHPAFGQHPVRRPHPRPHDHLGAASHRARGHYGLADRPDSPAAARSG